MNTTALNNRLTSRIPYWGELVRLSKEDKINVIAMLSLSIAETSEKEASKHDKTQEMIDRCCGSWVGEQTAEEIIANINASKNSKQEPVKFD